VLACSALLTVRAGAQTPPIFDELQAVHPNSVPGALATRENPDGSHTLYVAEGGALAFIAAENPSSYQNEIKIVPISSMGVQPVRLLPDPVNGGDLLFIAGGRFGLWVMDANDSPSSGNPAARIDDAEDAANPSVQNSRRWCCDVEVVSTAGQDYLLALLAEKDSSRLRAYPLGDARDVLLQHQTNETGHELAAVLEHTFVRNPAQPSGSAQSLALGMDVRGQDVYVAMGTHGLVRLRFQGSFQNPIEEWGPVFGDGTYYQQQPQGGDLYDDFHYKLGGVTQRQDPPFFVDVAVMEGHDYLYAAVDHLGWVRFDVENAAWGASTPIDRHEGVAITNQQGEKQVQLVDPGLVSGKVRTDARALELVETTPGKPALVVAAHTRPLIIEPGLAAEGRTLGALGIGFSGTNGALGDLTGKNPFALVYDASSIASSSQLPAGWSDPGRTENGGAVAHGLWIDVDPDPDLLWVFTGQTVGAFADPSQEPDEGRNTTVRAEFSWPTQPDEVPSGKVFRGAEDRPGRRVYDVGPGLVRPDVLHVSSNDGGLVPEQAELAVCSSGIELLTLYPWEAPSHNGVVFDADTI